MSSDFCYKFQKEKRCDRRNLATPQNKNARTTACFVRKPDPYLYNGQMSGNKEPSFAKVSAGGALLLSDRRCPEVNA